MSKCSIKDEDCLRTHYIKVSARVRPLISNERINDKILKVIEVSGKRILELETGAHYNMGRKYYDLKNIIGENSTQTQVFESC